MNNDLEQFSEERLIDMQKHITAGMRVGYADALLIRKAIEIALAAKQAKPVAFTSLRWLETRDKVEAYTAEDLFDEKYAKSGMKSVPLYTTPQPAHTEQVIPSEIPKVQHNGGMAYKKGGSIYSTNYARGWNDCVQAKLAAAPKPESE